MTPPAAVAGLLGLLPGRRRFEHPGTPYLHARFIDCPLQRLNIADREPPTEVARPDWQPRLPCLTFNARTTAIVASLPGRTALRPA